MLISPNAPKTRITALTASAAEDAETALAAAEDENTRYGKLDRVFAAFVWTACICIALYCVNTS
jgi:hypothetical protein